MQKDDVIYRQAAIDALRNNRMLPLGEHPAYNRAMRDSEKVIRNVPSAQPRKKGKWINHRNDDGHNIADCDQCGNALQWFDGDEIPRYCCMCGADMRGEGDETICD